jgi:hypothetical protein
VACCLARRAYKSERGSVPEPLPVGETGGSKWKAGGGEGDHPFCREPKAKEERGSASAAAGKPSTREGQRPIAFGARTSLCGFSRVRREQGLQRSAKRLGRALMKLA